MTPAWKQYMNIKKDYTDVVLLFRMGDFYEAFDNDAHILADILQITLTKKEFGKNQKHPLAGFPFHSLNHQSGQQWRHMKAHLLKSFINCLICQYL